MQFYYGDEMENLPVKVSAAQMGFGGLELVFYCILILAVLLCSYLISPGEYFGSPATAGAMLVTS